MVLDSQKQKEELLRILTTYTVKEANYQQLQAYNEMLGNLIQSTDKATVTEVKLPPDKNNGKEPKIDNKQKELIY